MQKKLSICIPTYNRQRFLEILFESVRNALHDEFRDSVEVCVSDNASTDCTAALIADWQRRAHFSINYAANTTNVGADRNYMAAAKLATGKYIWLMGSDDAIAPDSIERVLRILETPYQLVVSNRLDCTYGLAPLVSTKWLRSISSDMDFDFSDSRQLESYLEKSTSLGSIFSYLSSIIVETAAWHSVDLDEHYIGSLYSHAYICFKIVEKGARLRYVFKPLVLNRGDNDSFLNAGEVSRVMIDVRGYARLADSVFESRPTIRRGILNVLARERPPVYTAFYLARRAKQAEWREAVPFLRRIGTPRIVLWWLSVFPSTAQTLHIPLIRSVARKLLGRKQ